MEREGFVFYKSFWNAVKNMDDKTFKECVSAICLYAIEGYEGDPEGMAGTVLELVKPQIDANNKRYESGKKGGAPAGNNNAKKSKENNQKQPVVESKTTENNQGLNQEQPKDKVKDKEKVKEKEKEKVLLDALSDFSGLLQETIKDWMAYKSERNEKYTVTGLKNWLGQINNYRKRYSDKSVAGVISRTMAQGYQGVVWDWLKDEPRKPKDDPPPDTGPKDMLPPDEQAAKVKEMSERLGGMFGT